MLRSILASRKTTLLGILGFIGLVCTTLTAQFDGDPLTVPQWGQVFTELMLCISAVTAKDANVTGGTIQNPAGTANPKPAGG